MSRGHARATRQLRNRRGCAPGAKHLRATGRDEQRRAGTQAQGLRRGRGAPTHGGLRQHRRLSVRRERAHGPGLAAVGRPRLPAPPGRRRRTAGDQPDGRIERSRHIDPDARSAPTPQRAAAPQPRRAPAPPQHADRQQPRSSQRASRGPSPNATASPPVGGAGTGGTAPVRACSVAISAPGSAGAESGARAGADRAAAGSAAAPGVAQFPARVHVTPGSRARRIGARGPRHCRRGSHRAGRSSGSSRHVRSTPSCAIRSASTSTRSSRTEKSSSSPAPRPASARTTPSCRAVELQDRWPRRWIHARLSRKRVRKA